MRYLLSILVFLSCLAANAQIITTVAGNGTAGFDGDNGPATAAKLQDPNTAIFDSHGNMYINDGSNRRIRKVNTSGIITTIAGTGVLGSTGDGGPATAAQITPLSLAIDNVDNIYFSEPACIRKINTSGIISTVAGTGTSGYNGDGIPATTAKLDGAYLGGIDNSGNIYFADQLNHRVRKINAAGIISTIAGNGTIGSGGDTGPATAAQLTRPSFVALRSNGDIYIPDNAANRVRKIDIATGIITTIAGNGTGVNTGDNGPATAASIQFANSVAFDNSDNIYISSRSGNVVRKIDATGIITTIAGTGIAGYSGDEGPATASVLNTPVVITCNASGNLFIGDMSNNRIRKITYHPESVSDIKNSLKEICLYPDPAQNELNITAADKISRVVIKNIQGQVVLHQECNDRFVNIDISTIYSGVYLVYLNDVAVRKFSKK